MHIRAFVHQVKRCYTRKALYPSKRRYLLFLIPGGVIAIIGVSCYSFLATESTYWIVHSMWHTCIGLSVLFFLPPSKDYTSKLHLLCMYMYISAIN